MRTKLPIRLMTSIGNLAKTQLIHQIPHATSSLAATHQHVQPPVSFINPNFQSHIINSPILNNEYLERKPQVDEYIYDGKSESDEFYIYLAEIMKENRKNRLLKNILENYEDMDIRPPQKTAAPETPVDDTKQKAKKDEVEFVKDTNQKTDAPSGRVFTTPKSFSDFVFEELRKDFQKTPGLSMLFNLSENLIKKKVTLVLDGLFTVLAGKKGEVSEERAKNLAYHIKLLILAIVMFTIAEYCIKKYDDVKDKDGNVIENYLLIKDLYDKARLLALEGSRQMNSADGLKEVKERNENLLKLLRECANSDSDATAIDTGINHLRAVIDTVINNKSLERALEDIKIEKALQRKEEEGNPLATQLLEKKSAKGYKGTENALVDKIDKFNNIIKHKEEGAELKGKEVALKTAKIKELREETEKLEKKVMNNMLVTLGLFKPQHPKAIEQCNKARNELENVKTTSADDREIDDTLRMSVD